MADTSRTLAALQALLADNTSGDISPQDVRDMLVSLFPQTARGDLVMLDSGGLQSRLALGADHLFLGSDGSDAVYRNIGWDVILTPSGTNDHTQINTAITAGAKRILLLAGTHDIGGDIDASGAGSGIEIFGQGEIRTILDFSSADRRIICGARVRRIADLRCLDSTAESGAIDIDVSGSVPAVFSIERIHFRGCERAIDIVSNTAVVTKIIRDCIVSNNLANAGTPTSYSLNGINIWVIGGHITRTGGGSAISVRGTTVFLIGASIKVSEGTGVLLATDATIRCQMSGCSIQATSATSIAIDHQTGRLFSEGLNVDGSNVSPTSTLIQLASAKGASIKGGYVDGGSIGIKCVSSGNRISGVEIENTASDGIKIESNGNMVNSGNYVHDSGGYGINVASGSKNIIDGNRIVNNSSGQIQDDGTDTLLGLNNTTV